MAITLSKPQPSGKDPFLLVKEDLKQLKQRIKKAVGGYYTSGNEAPHPVLSMAAQEFFERKGKSFRPTITMLMSLATSGSISSKQAQLAEITELIHTASLIHNDVLEDVEESSAGNVVHRMYSTTQGNKVSVLAGDFLLARAAVGLAKLGVVKVVEIMATALDSIVQGDIMQVEATADEIVDYQYYINRVKSRSANLIGLSCQSAALLGGAKEDDDATEAALQYGLCLGMAHQMLADLKQLRSLLASNKGEGTEPLRRLPNVALLAEHCPTLKEVIQKSHTTDEDWAKAIECIERSNAVHVAEGLVADYANNAIDSLSRLPPSEARTSLEILVHKVLEPSFNAG